MVFVVCGPWMKPRAILTLFYAQENFDPERMSNLLSLPFPSRESQVKLYPSEGPAEMKRHASIGGKKVLVDALSISSKYLNSVKRPTLPSMDEMAACWRTIKLANTMIIPTIRVVSGSSLSGSCFS